MYVEGHGNVFMMWWRFMLQQLNLFLRYCSLSSLRSNNKRRLIVGCFNHKGLISSKTFFVADEDFCGQNVMQLLSLLRT